jgi:thiopurine S-methyltransferase
MQPDFWHERWRLAQTPFHQASVESRLKQYWPELNVAPQSKVFVPLCGKSLDLLWLAQQGHSVTGVELSALAVESFLMENGIPAKRRTLGSFDVYETERLQLFCGDFFKFSPEILGEVEAVYDRAALIAWTPELRRPYVDHMAALTNSGTHTLLISVEYSQNEMKGPPFSVAADEIDALYGKHHEIRQLGRQDILANEPRFRARGLAEMHEVYYHLTRK